MAKKKRVPTQESEIKRCVRTPQYRMRVVKSAKAYSRKSKYCDSKHFGGMKGSEPFYNLAA